jgi:RNA polymerase sigma factor (TIGR02999 family)
VRKANAKPLIGMARMGRRRYAVPFAMGRIQTAAPASDDLSGLLRTWGAGGTEDRGRTAAAIHGELRRIAVAYLRRERRDHTLQPTALINEAYLRLLNGRPVTWESRAHFFGVAARIMRQVLVDYARRHRAVKRGSPLRCVDRSPSKLALRDRAHDVDVLALHEALDDLAALDARQAQIVELRYFGGLTEAEVSAMMKVSQATVRRDLLAARFWLGRRLKGA